MSQALLPQNYKGYFTDIIALITAIPNGQKGYWVIIEDVGKIYIWKDSTSEWVDVGATSSTGVQYYGHYATPEELPFFPANGSIAIVGDLNVIYIFDIATYFAWVSTGVSASGVYTNANQVFTKSQAGAITLANDSSTITLDFSLPNFKVVLGGDRELGRPNNIVPGTGYVLDVWQDSTGNRLLTYDWVFEFPGGPITLKTGAFERDQLNLYTSYYATSTITLTIGSPCVVTWTSHGLISGQKLRLDTDGNLPTGLAIDTTYWVNVIDDNTFSLAASFADLQAGTFIDTSGTQDGTHSATAITIDVFN